MTKHEFISRLRDELIGLSDEDIRGSVDFYGEIIDDIIESGASEEDAVAALGSAEEVAANIRAQSSVEEEVDESAAKKPLGNPPTETGRAGDSGNMEDFKDIFIDAGDADVRIVLSESGEIEVECPSDTENKHYVTSVNDGTLTIKQIKAKNLYRRFFGMNLSSLFTVNTTCSEIKVSLPPREFGSLCINTVSGDINVEEGISFASVVAKTMSGDVGISSSVKNELIAKSVSGDVTVTGMAPNTLNLSSTSGDVTLSSVRYAGYVSAWTASGDVELTDVSCKTVTCGSKSADVTLYCVIADNVITCTDVSGDIQLRKCDAGSLKLTNISGDVNGTLLSEKTFVASTVSGNVYVPPISSDRQCVVTTVSGDILFSLE